MRATSAHGRAYNAEVAADSESESVLSGVDTHIFKGEFVVVVFLLH